MARTSLMTLIFLSPAAVRTTSNSVFSSTGAAAAAAAARGGDRHRRGSRHAPLLLEQLGELRRLQHRQAGEVVNDFR